MRTRAHRDRHSRRRTPLARLVGAIALLFPVALAPVLGVLHLALVPHGLCPEHGELIELDARAPVVHAHHLVGVGANEQVPGSDSCGHHHCEVVPQRLNPTAQIDVARSANPPAIAVLAIGSIPIATPRAVPLLHLAPKASPPV